MDGLEFLRMVWPLTGPYLLSMPITWWGKNDAGERVEKHGHKQFAFDTVEQAYEAALYACGTDGEDVYYALGSLKELKRNDKGNLEGPRKRGNIKELRSFWLDIDVKPDQPEIAYSTQREAFVALRDFVKQNDLPSPYVVSSGVGLHVYWPLTDGLDGDKWNHYADLFKQITVEAGLKADPSRTSDRASILRVPDTQNRKPGRAVTNVEVKVTGSVTPTEDMLKKLAFLASTKNLKAAPPRANAQINVNAAVAANNALANTFAPVAVNKVLKRCPHLQWQFDNPTAVPQPLWYAMIGVLRHCINGDKACHVMSQRDPARYDANAVDTKIAQLANGGYGPTTCTKFELEGSTHCKTCKWKGKVGSPITLATMAEEVAAPKMVALIRGQETEMELPEPRFPYKRVANDGDDIPQIVMQLTKKVDGETQDEDIVIYDYDIYPYAIVYDEAIHGFAAKIRHWLPMEGWQDITLPFGEIYDGRKFSSIFGNLGVMVSASDNMKYLEGYMRGYIAELQKKVAAQVIYSQLGWKDDGTFVLPGMVVAENSVGECVISTNVARACNDAVPPEGDLEVWKEVADAYNKPECVAHQFTMACGFASPLLALTNFKGAIVAATGEAGCGKSSASHLANSIMNHKRVGDITDRDTGNALYAKLGTTHNLLATYDESTKLNGDQLSNLAYAINQGQGKNRLDRNANFKENVGDWALLMLMTTNKNPQAILGAYSSDAYAEASRIFQYYVPPRTLTKEFADEVFDKLNYNFGLAGPIYMQAVMADKVKVRERIKHWVKTIDRLANVGSNERFWSIVPACVITGVEVARSVGLVKYDVRGLLEFSIRCINSMRVSVSENVATPLGLLAEYLNSNLRNTLILGSIPGGTQPVLRQAPTAELRIRIDDGLGRASIDRAHIRKFCVEKGTDPALLREELTKIGVLLDDNRKVVLGKGTTLKSVQTRCWEIDMTNSAMTGVADFVSNYAANANANVVPIAGKKAVP